MACYVVGHPEGRNCFWKVVRTIFGPRGEVLETNNGYLRH